jgi:hypothetical protein
VAVLLVVGLSAGSVLVSHRPLFIWRMYDLFLVVQSLMPPCVHHLGLVQMVDSNLCVVCVCGDMCVRYIVCELDQLVLE